MVSDLHTRGLVKWGPDGAAVLVVPSELESVVRQDRQTINAVLRRATVFLRQLATSGPDPFVRLRDARWTTKGCPSCGGRLAERELRCELCSVAAELALDVQTDSSLAPSRPQKTRSGSDVPISKDACDSALEG